MLRMLAFLVVALATVPVAADEASEPSISEPSARSPVVSEPGVRTHASHNTRAAIRPLVIDLGPLPVEEKDAQIPQRTSKRRQIGIHRPLSGEFTGNLVPHLDWTADTDGQHTAAITFSADGAISLRIAVQATLPSGASVQVFDGDGQPRGSAFTQADFNASGNALAWLPSAEGDTLTVQITLPSAEAVEALSFTVTSVAHRFASIVPQADPECSGHVDISCVGSQIAHDIADAVGQMTFEDHGSTYVCTGTLLAVGDTPVVFEPYFLTANHCVATNTVAATVVVRWFWQTATCNGLTIDPHLNFSFRGTDLLATSPAQDSTLLQFKERLPGGLSYAGWNTEKVRNDTSMFSVHHPNGFAAQYSEGRVQRTVTVNVDGNIVYDAIETDWSRGLTEGGSSGAGLFDGGQLFGVHSGGEGSCSTRGNTFGPFRDFFPRIHQWLKPSTYEPETFTHLLPAVPGAGGSIQGFIRITNASGLAGEVEIYAIDDAGHRYGPLTLSIDAYQTRHFNSDDLERGAPSKGIFGGVGSGTGMWRLDLRTTLTISARAYIRTPDGFVTSMHQLADTIEHEVLDARLNNYILPFFNPGSNTAIRSLLRVINPHPFGVGVTLFGLDDGGILSGPVQFDLAANSAMQISSQALERGDGAFRGSLGDGDGKWVLVVSGSVPLHVMSLLSTASGHLTNLSR